jgi:CheY-like chemotaxis protein
LGIIAPAVTLEARDGLAAVQLFTQNSTRIDIAVLDLTLPGLSGYDVCDEILRLKMDARVIFTSAHEPAARDESSRQTEQRHLQKPYRLRELIQTIREVMALPGRTRR